MNGTQIKFYKEQIGKFSNVDYSTEDYSTKTAKGKLIDVSDDGMLFVQGDYKSWTISIDKINNSSFSEWKDVGSKND